MDIPSIAFRAIPAHRHIRQFQLCTDSSVRELVLEAHQTIEFASCSVQDESTGYTSGWSVRMNSPSVTSASLLARIRRDDRDERAWREFVDRYGPRIFSWCRSRRLQQSDAEDVTQEVLTKLARHLGSFEYDSTLTFRGWLRRVTENALADFFTGRRRALPDGTEVSQEVLETRESQLDLGERLSAAFDLELFELAKSRVCSRVAPNRWAAWELTAIHRQPNEEVAVQLNLKVAAVYSIRWKIQQMIRKEIEVLESSAASTVLGT